MENVYFVLRPGFPEDPVEFDWVAGADPVPPDMEADDGARDSLGIMDMLAIVGVYSSPLVDGSIVRLSVTGSLIISDNVETTGSLSLPAIMVRMKSFLTTK